MPTVNILAAAAATLGIAQAVPYTVAILRGRTKPSQLTAIVWSVVGTVQAVAMLASGAGGGAALNVAFAATSYITLVLSFKHGLRNRATLDVPLAILATASLAAWAVAGPEVAIVLAASVIVIGYVSCIAKLWRNPGTEDPLAWSLTTAGAVCSLAVLVLNAAGPVLFVPPIVTFTGSSTVLVIVAVQSHQARRTFTRQRVLVTDFSAPTTLAMVPASAVKFDSKGNDATTAKVKVSCLS